MKRTSPHLLARCLRDYFADHLLRLREMSAHTIHSYRDSLVLLLRFVASDCKREVCDLDLEDIQPDRVLAFLSLAAIHAFFRYVGAHHPAQMERAQRIPFKRADQRVIEYLDRNEIEAVLKQMNRSTMDGRRDYALSSCRSQQS